MLTVSSIFLCGIVVTYVANADNFKQKYDQIKSGKDSLSRKLASRDKQVEEANAQKKQLEDRLNSDITSLRAKFNDTEAKLKNAEREKASLLQKVNSWVSITRDFTKTNDKQGLLLKNTLEDLNRVKAEQIIEHKELNETTVVLVEKMAIIETLQAQNNRLLEEKVELENKLDSFLQTIDKTPARFVPVTPEPGPARMVKHGVRDIGLKGLVTAVDLKNSMASISLGTADGVKIGMKFHVTRGDKFLCDILIIDVDTEEAVGVLELLQQAPKVGDNVSTNL